MLLQTLYRFSRWLLTRVLNVQCSWVSWISATVHCPMPICIFFPHCLCTTCRPYPNSKNFHFVKMRFICTRIKYFHTSDLALTFPLKQWLGATQKWPTYLLQGSHSLDKSLNFRENPWKVLEFHFSLKSPNKFPCKSFKKVLEFSSTLECTVVAWKVFFDAFWLSKTGYESLISCSRFYICYACTAVVKVRKVCCWSIG